VNGRACPGTCNAAHRRNGTGAPVAGDPVWCRRCRALIRARLLDLDDQAALLSALEGGHRSRTGERVSGSRERPSPAPYIDDLDELLHTLLSWEDAYREHRGLAPRPRRGRFAPTLSGNIAWLAAHLDGLLAFDGAADFGREVLRLHRAPELIPTVLDLVEGDLIRLTDLPDWLPPGPVDLIVQGMQHRVGVRTWEVDLVCAPGSPWRIGILDDEVLGRVDTDGSQLAAGVDEDDTTLSVTVTEGPEWALSATYPDEFPFDITVGGEVMTVTAISGSAPQTFTVTRAVNGVTKRHTAGTDVRLATPTIVAL